MTDVKVGDKVLVTVTHEGKISRIDSYGIRVEGWGLVGPSDEGTTVEIIERAKPKVGDFLSSRADYDAVPSGTVISSINSTDAGYIKVGGKWYVVESSAQGQTGASYPGHDSVSRRQIRYIPEG